MLVCNVSLRPPRAGIIADIVEAIEATDATASGQVVFATLVDDPASVGDRVDAYLGEIMVEAASAAATVEAGLIYGAAIDETVTALEVFSASVPGIVVADLVEAASAADAVDWVASTDAGWYGVLGVAGPIPPADPAHTIIYIEV